MRISGGSQKSGKDQVLPLVPDFAQWLLRTPKGEQVGPVFRFIGLETGEPISSKRVSRIVTKIGKRAGIVVNREMKRVEEDVVDSKTGVSTGRIQLVVREVLKFASCHDLRRSFGTRWAKKVMPATLKLLMRHSSVSTSMAYYVDMDVDEVAAGLWAQHQPEARPEKDVLGTVLGTAEPNEAQNEKKGPEQCCSKPLSSNDF